MRALGRAVLTAAQGWCWGWLGGALGSWSQSCREQYCAMHGWRPLLPRCAGSWFLVAALGCLVVQVSTNQTGQERSLPSCVQLLRHQRRGPVRGPGLALAKHRQQAVRQPASRAARSRRQQQQQQQLARRTCRRLV